VHAVELVRAQHLMTTERAEIDGEITGLLGAKEYRQAFDLLLPHYKDRVFRLCISIMRNESLAEDVAQEVFLRIWKALPGFQGQASISTWIYAITRNRCLTELRKVTSRPTVSLNQLESESLHEFAAPGTESQAGCEMDVDWMLGQLPEKYSRAISLFYLEQRSYEDVAAMLGVPLGTVKTYLYRGKRELLKIAARNPAVSTRKYEANHETCRR
jgi:RNA polymerase sigma-70 factor, ECF subfamily